MGTTSEKLTYLNVTKQKLKQAINNIGGEITNETTFRQYANQLQNVYDRLPKTEYQEGTEVNLGKTIKGKLDYDNGVVGIGQSSQDSTKGYQLFDIGLVPTANKQYVRNNGFILTKGINRTIQIGLHNPLPAGTYTLSAVVKNSTLSNNSKINCSFKNSNNVDVVGNVSFLTNGTITTTAEVTQLYFFIVSSETDGVTITLDDIMLETGTTAHDWEPYTGGQASPNPSYPQEIKYVRGKNRLNPNQYINAVVNNTSIGSTGTLVAWASSWVTWVKMEKNQTYVFSGDLSHVNSNVVRTFVTNSEVAIGTSVTRVDNLQNGSTYINTNGYKYLVLEFLDVSAYEGNWQLEKGSQATPYLPYNTIEVKARGKNKLDFSQWLNTLMAKNPNINDGSINGYTNNSITITSNGNDCFTASYTISTNATANKTFCETYPSLVQEVKGNTKYTISYNRSNTSLIARPCFFYLDENYNYLGLSEDRTATDIAIFTTPSNARYLTFRFGLYGSTGSTLTISNLMIEESPSATSYEPYYTPQIKQLSLGNFKPTKIGNYKDYFYRTSGKNKFDSEIEVGGFNNSGLNIASINRLRSKDYIEVTPNTQYTLQTKNNTTKTLNASVSYYTTNDYTAGRIGFVNWSGLNLTFTTPANCKYIRLLYKFADESNMTVSDIENIQIELGNTATDYNPYGSGEWYFKGKIAEVILNSSYRASGGTTGTNAYYIATKLTDGLNDNSNILAYSNMFKGISFDSRTGAPDSVMLQSGSVTLRTRNNTDIDWSDNTKRDNWLNTNLPIVYYVLAIPTDTKITDTTMITQLEEIYNLMSYTGTTILEVDGDLPLVIKVRALKGAA